ncbi:PXA domain-containing protein [Nemania sp. NC0429]|nr:PXA domain-containing protein [Nemania sp. NC0429]
MAITTSSIPSTSAGAPPLPPPSPPPPTSSKTPTITTTITNGNTAEHVAPTTTDRRSPASSPPSLSPPLSPLLSPSPSSHSPSPSPSPPSPPNATSSSQARRHPTRSASREFLSDKATAALIRRTLCARHLADRGRNSPSPIQDLLPPLTSRNDVDLQLYALISIVLREFVQNWYNKITPDETFVAEIVQVIAHCTRGLEQRLRKVDLESLLFDELPELLATHVRAYRLAASPTTTSPLRTDSHQIYHSLWPLPALSPVPEPGNEASIQAQADNESAYRQLLVHGVLAVLLPTEDLENECLTSLVGQLLSELVLGNLVAAKLSEPWLIWEILIMATRLVHKRSSSGSPDGPDDPDGFPDKSTTVPHPSSIHVPPKKGNRPWSLDQVFWSFVQWIFLVAGMIRFIISIGTLSRSLPPRPHPSAVRIVETTDPNAQQDSRSPSYEALADAQTRPAKTPVIEFHIWRCIADLLEVEARMPWLQGTLSMVQWIALKGPGRVAALNGILDRLMSHYIHIRVLDPAHLPPLLRAIRAALFPNNAPGVSSLKPPSSGEELATLRRRCASALWGLLPKAVGELYYGTNKGPWSGVKACIITNEGVDVRTDPVKSGSSNFDNEYATNLRGGINVGSSRMPLPKENYPMIGNDATLSLLPQGHSQGSNGLDQTHPGYDNEDEARRLSEIETGIVDLFSDAYCNKHLIYGILELVLVRLVPELAEKGVGELWEERLH